MSETTRLPNDGKGLSSTPPPPVLKPKNSSVAAVMVDRRPTTHITLQSKGGVGKTFVASLVAQWIIENGRALRCYDADPGNQSFCARVPAYDPVRVPIRDVETGYVIVSKLDEMMQAALTEDRD